MSSRRSVRQLVVAVLFGVLVGGGLMAVTPAGAEVSNAVATNWKKIWKKHLRPLADKRYYTKAKSDARYDLKGSGYTKAESDAKYAGAGTSYSKAEVDAKLAPFANSVAAFAGGDQVVALEAADQVVRSVSLMPTANGTVIANSSAYVWSSAAADGGARCSLTTGSAVDFDFLQYVNMPAAVSPESEVIAGTRAFPVTKGVLFTVNLVCDEFAGTMNVSDSAITAIFAPS